MLRGPSSLAVCSWARTFCRHRLRQKAVSPMSAHFPDSETIHTVLSLATRAPSIHYSEPWHCGLAPRPESAPVRRSQHAFAEHRSRQPRSAVELRRIAAPLCHRIVGLRLASNGASVPNSSEPEHLAAVELYRPAATELDVTLAAAIPRRRTDRQLVAGARCRYQLDGRPRGTRGRDVATSRVTSEAARDCG